MDRAQRLGGDLSSHLTRGCAIIRAAALAAIEPWARGTVYLAVVSERAQEAEFRILLVEDEPVIRELVRSLLSEETVSVECASDGLECLKLVKSRPFRLILLDVVLPGLDGISVCRLIKSDPATSAVPLYMLTAKAKPSDVAAAMKAGANGYIHKPFRGADLMALVARLKSAAQ